MTGHLRASIASIIAFTVLLGLLYPLAVTGVAQLAFPHQAEGSLIRRGDVIVGSELIGQPFSAPEYFWSRPSATGPSPYNAGASSGSNLGPVNDALVEAAQARIDALHQADPGNDAPIPVDLVTASGSGLDPHISPASAEYQLARVARARDMDESQVRDIVTEHTEGRFLGFLGEARVNVLTLNLALDDLG